MAFSVTVKLDDVAYRQQLERLVDKLRGGDDPNLRAGLKQAGLRYLGFIRRRFLAAARGDGTWPDLALSTKLRRIAKNGAVLARYNRALHASGGDMHATVASMRFEILRDTGLLFNSLSTGSPGNVTEESPLQIRVGTAVRYAIYHQDGGPRLPQRKIIVEPDDPTLVSIGNDLTRGVRRAIEANFGTGAGGGNT